MMRGHNALALALAAGVFTFESKGEIVLSDPIFPFEAGASFFENMPLVRDLQAIDFDQDGDEDLVVHYQQRERVDICWQDDGILSAPETLYLNANGRTSEIAFGDADGDGDLDLFVASYETGKLRWAENQGRGVILAPIHPVTSLGSSLDDSASQGNFAESARNLAVDDLDGDGAVEVVCGFSFPNGFEFRELPLVLFENDGSGNFSLGSHLRPADAEPLSDVKFVDLGGGAGRYLLATQSRDLAVSNLGKLFCWPVEAAGLGASASADLGSLVGRVLVADVDDDGAKEALVLESYGKRTDIGQVTDGRLRVFEVQSGQPQEVAVLVWDRFDDFRSPFLLESNEEVFFLSDSGTSFSESTVFSPGILGLRIRGIELPLAPVGRMLLEESFGLGSESFQRGNTIEVKNRFTQLDLQGVSHLVEVVGIKESTPLGTFLDYRMQARRILTSEVTVPTVLVRAEDDGVLLSGALLAVEVTRDVADFEGTVSYTTRNGSAFAGLDYTAKSGTLDFEIGEFSKTFILSHLADNEVEGGENYFVDFSTSSSGFVLAEDELEVLILDSATSTLQFDTVRTVLEPVGGEFVTPPLLIQMNKSTPSAEVSFSYRFLEGTATEGSDYQAGGGTVTIPEGQSFGLISLTPLQDNLFEEEETLEVEIYDVSGATLNESRITIQIQDRVGPRFELTGPSVVPEGGGRRA